MARMSSMIVELTNTINSRKGNIKISRTKRRFFQRPLRNPPKCQSLSKSKKLGIDTRFPWTHRSEPGTSDVLHSGNVLPWMNHSAVPWWRDLQAVWWFFHGSGADSHPKISFCKLSPVGRSRWSQSSQHQKKKGSRFALFKSLASWCIISDTQSYTR